MPLRCTLAVRAAAVSALLLLFVFHTTEAHNITAILARESDFSVFNHYLTTTHLAGQINHRSTVTVLALDNGAMNALLKTVNPQAIKNVLTLHVILDYFSAKKLHQITGGTVLSTSLYRTTGHAPDSEGFVNITDLKGGKVAFTTSGSANLISLFVKSIKEIPYNISVIQISHPLSSPTAEAPSPSPAQKNLTSIMAGKGCGVFAEALANNSGASTTFTGNLDSGLTVFCPGDDAFKAFLPKFRNLTVGDRESLLEFHATPVYYSMEELKSNNGLQNSLATDKGSFKFSVQNQGEHVELKAGGVTAGINGTIMDDDPLAIYKITRVLLPKEFFKTAEAPSPSPSPSPSPAPAAESPKKGKRKRPATASPPAPGTDDASDAPSPGGDDPADQTSAGVAVGVNGGGLLVTAVLSIFLSLFLAW